MFEKILIANRGEIACRVMKTAQALGIRCVAVYSKIDQNALHVQMADEAYLLGEAPSQDSYLKGERIIQIAKKAGAQAIHPVYGFLSENASFAKACEDQGLVFIGPSAAAITAMGSKSAAKKIMGEAKIPLIPGYHGDNQEPDFLGQEAQKMGFPVLIKAIMGGGGKGMRLVENPKEFKDALNGARREALAAFGNDIVLLEKYLVDPRHIEIQIMADTLGNAVYLFERDCSIQRRHQKVIEEAPASKLSERLRQTMGKAAVTAAKAIDYHGAGTLEFLVDKDENFYFMEMNTRLQVEHPVTEMITGLDLVAWQLQIAAGLPLPLQQADLKLQGHAIELRLYAEDPNHEFLPATGHIDYLSWPKTSAEVRIDTGVRENDTISSYYDPMIAKLIVHAENREAAIFRMQSALSHWDLIGVKTNKQFLQDLLSLPDYKAAKISTHFIAEHSEALKPRPPISLNKALCAAALYTVLTQCKEQPNTEDRYSPWLSLQGFRLQLPYTQKFYFEFQDKLYPIAIYYNLNKTYQMRIGTDEYQVSGVYNDKAELYLHLNSEIDKLKIFAQKSQIWVLGLDQEYALKITHTLAASNQTSAKTHLNAPMPGAIVAVNVKPGDTVQKDECLMVMEAMKMEHSIYAPQTGVINEIFYAIGDRVDEGAELLTFK